MKQTVVVTIPTSYDDSEQAFLAVLPYLRAMRVTFGISDIRNEQRGDDDPDYF